jgi:hypothetical protein
MKLVLLIASGTLSYLLFAALVIRLWAKVEPVESFLAAIITTGIFLFAAALFTSPIVFIVLLLDLYYPSTISGW